MSTQPIDERAVKAIAGNVYYADLGEDKVRRVAEACERAGIPAHTFHGLRHDFGSLLLAAGVPTRVVQEMLGHADIATTQIYTHVLSERLPRLVREHHPLAKRPARNPRTREGR